MRVARQIEDDVAVSLHASGIGIAPSDDRDDEKDFAMRPILASGFDYSPTVEIDIHSDFDHIWRELGDREDSEQDSGTDAESVWLECNGELVDADCVKNIKLHKARLGMEMVEFDCPRCNQRHESLRFR